MYNYGSHVIHYLEKMTGPLDSISAHVEDFNLVLIGKNKVGAHLSATISFNQQNKFVHQIHVMGDRGELVLENNSMDYAAGFKLTITGRNGKKEYVDSQNKSRHPEDGRLKAIQFMMKRFVDSIIDQKKDGNFHEAARVAKISECMLTSSKANKWVSI